MLGVCWDLEVGCWEFPVVFLPVPRYKTSMPASREDRLFLQLAVRNRLLTDADAGALLLAHEASAARGNAASVADLLRARGSVPEETIRKIEEAVRKAVAAGPPSAGTARLPPAGKGPPPGAAPALAKDEVVPGFRVVGKIGAGGMATVFRAVETRTGASVALKVLMPAQARNADSLGRFRREAELLVKIRHPHVVRGIRSGQHGPLHYLAMDLVDGRSIQQIMDHVQKPLDESTAIDIILQVARALDHIESLGYVHRDVKPENVIVTAEGRAVLIDLGFAQPLVRGADATGVEDLTSGTAAYMSPEQARGLRDLDVRSDIYALGATLYHMVMGATPFKGTDSLDLMAKQVMEELHSGEIKNSGLSKHMHYFIERMMSKDKEFRFASCAELIATIEEQVEGFRSLHYDKTGAPSTHSNSLADLVRRVMAADAGAPSGPGRSPSAAAKISARLQHLTRRLRRR